MKTLKTASLPAAARWNALVAIALLVLAGCNTSSPPPTAAVPPRNVEPVAKAEPVAPAREPAREKLMSDKPAEAPALLPVNEAIPVAQPDKSPAVASTSKPVDPKPADTSAPAEPAKLADAAEPAKSEPLELAAVGKAAPVKSPVKSTTPAKAPAKAPAAAAPPPPPPAIPPVLLSDAEAKTCLVKVGDPMPAIELPAADGQPQSLAKLLGEKLTVVVFWTANHPYAVEELGDLAAEVAVPLATKGVKVVAINEGDTPEAARKAAEGVGAGDLIQLQDTGGQALAKVATRRLPRTYLLDASGKILWFDLEYSRSTRRDLMHAIQFVLTGK